MMILVLCLIAFQTETYIFCLPSSIMSPKNTRSWRGELKCEDRDVEGGIDICSGVYRGSLQLFILMALTMIKKWVAFVQRLGSSLLRRREIKWVSERSQIRVSETFYLYEYSRLDRASCI